MGPAEVLVGQADLLARLREFAVPADDRAPHSALLTGGHGAGKTALLEAVARSARSAGTRLVWIRGQQVGDAPFALLRQLLGQLADVLTGLPEDHQVTLLSAAGCQVEAGALEIL